MSVLRFGNVKSAVFALLLGSVSIALAQTYTPVTIVVTDPSGAAISGAYIQFTPGTTTGENLVTDEHGKLSVGLNPGKYHLRVSAQGYPPSEQDVAIESKPQTITVSLSTGGGSPQVVAVPDNAMAMDVLTAPSTAAASANTLVIVGVAGERGVFTAASFKDYPHQTVTIFDHHTNANETYSGVLLMDLLAHLGVPHGADLKSKVLADYIVAIGSDGYKSVVALGEIDPEFHPGTVLVADTMDGKPLDKAGPFRLIVTEDKRPARSVRNLVRIELKTAE
jgi:hypothetical protein